MNNEQKITRGLIIRQPWADMILDGKKTWEMRSKQTNVRGRIALIEQGSGLIVGECWLLDSTYPLSDGEFAFYYICHKIKDTRLLKKWRIPWVIGTPKRYDKPIPYKHPQGAVVWVDLEKAGVDLSKTK